MDDRTRKLAMLFHVLSGLTGLLWMAGSAAALGLGVYALFFGGKWVWVLYAVGVAFVGKSLMSGFADHADKAVIKGFLISKGVPSSVASDAWFQMYKRGGKKAARELLDLPDHMIEQLKESGQIIPARRIDGAAS
jgi:hypothetical protein